MLSNQTFISFITIGVMMTITGLVLPYVSQNFNFGPFLVEKGLWVTETSGFFMLLLNGTFVKTRYARIVTGILALTLVGTLFKIMHWPFGIEVNIVLSMGCIGITVLYILHFRKKRTKKRLDYLKLAWVSVLYIGAVLKLYHLIPRDYRILTTVLMILAIMDYILPKIKNKTLFE